MRIHCLTHVPFEGSAVIADWARRRGDTLSLTPVFEGQGLPRPTDFDWLIVMGGPMGVHDEAEHPWLAAEKRFLGEAIAAGKTVVGICLGAQLIAHALGAAVHPNPEREIGWFPIELTEAGRSSSVLGFLPDRIQVFHWHGDTFELPPGAIHLARSAACSQQVFLYDGRVLGLQCHLESTPEGVADLLAHCAEEIEPRSTSVQSAERMLAADAHDYARIHGALFGILDRLAELRH